METTRDMGFNDPTRAAKNYKKQNRTKLTHGQKENNVMLIRSYS